MRLFLYFRTNNFTCCCCYYCFPFIGTKCNKNIANSHRLAGCCQNYHCILQRQRNETSSHGVYVTSMHLFGGKTQRCRTIGEQSVNVKNVENAFQWAQIVRCMAEICTRAIVVVAVCLCHSCYKEVVSKLFTQFVFVGNTKFLKNIFFFVISE